MQVSSKSVPTAFIKTGFSNWKKVEVFSKHEKSDCHKHSVQAYRHWKYQKPVHHQISKEAERRESYHQQNVVFTYNLSDYVFLFSTCINTISLVTRKN